MIPTIKYLSDEELALIHRTSLDILARIGLRLPSPTALEALAGAGASIEADQVAKIPAEAVEKAIAGVPKRGQVKLHGREPAHDFDFEADRPALTCMTMATAVIDPDTGLKRAATDGDLQNLTRLAHLLPNVQVNGGLVTPQEVPGATNDWSTWATTLKNTTKHITGGVLGQRGVRDAAAMAALACGGEDQFRVRPCISGWVLALPPLGIDTASLEALLELGRQAIPAVVSSGPILGTTSPITIAGTLAQAHAELLGLLTVHQLIAPGAPFIYTSFARGIDMRTGTISMACPEFAILKVAMAQLGRSLDLPVRMPALLRDAKLLDAQAGFETGLVGGLTSLAADIMDGMQLDMDLVVDYADPVFCNDCLGGLKRLARPISFESEDLALEALAEVGPGGSFLGHKHTFTRFRTELWQPDLLERRNWEAWEQDGGLDVRTRSLARAKELLAADWEPLIDERAAGEIDAVLAAAQRDLVG